MLVRASIARPRPARDHEGGVRDPPSGFGCARPAPCRRGEGRRREGRAIAERARRPSSRPGCSASVAWSREKPVQLAQHRRLTGARVADDDGARRAGVGRGHRVHHRSRLALPDVQRIGSPHRDSLSLNCSHVSGASARIRPVQTAGVSEAVGSGWGAGVSSTGGASVGSGAGGSVVGSGAGGSVRAPSSAPAPARASSGGSGRVRSAWWDPVSAADRSSGSDGRSSVVRSRIGGRGGSRTGGVVGVVVVGPVGVVVPPEPPCVGDEPSTTGAGSSA